MAKIFANLILKHGNSADLDVSKLQPCEPVFLTDTNKLVIKKLDGEIATFDNYKNIIKTIENKDYLTGYAILEDGTLQLMSGDKVVGDPITLGGKGGLAFDSGYIDDNGYLHLTADQQDIDNFTPFFVGSGGSGSSGSKLTFSMLSQSSFSVADASKSAVVKFNFVSLDSESEVPTGNGNLKITVNGTVKKNLTVSQGENAIDVFEFLNLGSNTVKLNITDSYGVTATRTISITVETLKLEWNLGNTLKNTDDTLSVVMTPYGSGTKKIYIQVDDSEPEIITVTISGRKVTKELSLTVGSHIVTAYCTVEVDGTTLKSDVLKSAVAQTSGSSNPVIAVLFDNTAVKQYDTINIIHRIIDNNSNPTEAKYYINGTLLKTETVDQSELTWSYRPSKAGTVKFKIECGSVTWEDSITVEPLDIGVTEVTENLEKKIEPSSMVSLDDLVLSDNFDTINGGLITEADGTKVIKVVKGDRLTIPYKLFSDDAKKNGKEIKLIYKVDNCSDFNAKAISCKSNGIGLEVFANKVVVNSEQTEATLQTCEGIKTELDINITSDTAGRLMNIWECGSPASAEVYADGDNFAQSEPVDITIGSDDCNVYLYIFRCYSRSLTNNELTANFIVDGKDGIEISDRAKLADIYDTSGNISVEKVIACNPDAHIMTFHAPSISVAKTNKVTGYLTHTYTAGGSRHTWTAENVEDKVQGTSSAGYSEGSLNHDFNCKNGFILDDGTEIEKYAMTDNSIPVNYFNFKVNQASSENTNNTLISEWYNRYQPYIRPARASNPKVRDTVEGHMAVLFYHNTGSEPVKAGSVTVQPDETILYGIGNLNNSKKNYEVFAQNDEDDVAVIEICNNTSDLNRFLTDDLSNETWDGENSYEFRYKSDKITTEEVIAKWQKLLTFIVSCNPDKATNSQLTKSVTYGKTVYNTDSTEYRKAKFKNEIGNYVIIDTVLYHYLFTLFFSMVDNRAKNTFWGYSKSADKWHLAFSYDHDTAMGIDNEGGLTLRAGYLDTDIVGSRAVFNASDSLIFRLVRETMADELRTMYINLENKGCWDIDEINKFFETNSNYICTSLWIEDAYKKYLAPYLNSGTTVYISMLNGKKRLQRRQFLEFQRQFISSYFISSYATKTQGTIRCYTPSEWSGVEPKSVMNLTAYYDTFITVKAGSSTSQIRANAGQEVELKLGVSQMNDTEVYIYNSEFIQDVGKLACLYPGLCDLSSMIRLKNLNIGSNEEGYSNTNLTDVAVKNCESLETLSIENCSSFSKSLDLTNNVMLKNLSTKGTNCSGVAFANGGKLENAILNNSIASLTIKNLKYIKNVVLDNYSNISTLIIENTPYFSSNKSLVELATSLKRLRLININWTLDRADLLLKLYQINGVNDDGYNTEHAVITGNCSITTISQSRLDSLANYYNSLKVTAVKIIPEFTVRFMVDDTVYYTELVEQGSAATLPPNPTKEPTASTQYEFVGWAGSDYIRVIKDVDVPAIFSESVRKYHVRYYNGSTLLQENEVEYGDICNYEGEEPYKSDDYLFDGWDNDVTTVTEDTDYHAQFVLPELPTYRVDDYSFLASDDESDNAPYTPENIYAICKAGVADQYFKLGDKIKIVMTDHSLIKDEMIVLNVADFKHFKLADGSDFAEAVFLCVGVLNQGRIINSTATNVGGWDASSLNKWLNSSLINALPLKWRRIMKSVKVLASAGDQSTKIVETTAKIFIPSLAEVGVSTSELPYKNEVDAEALHKAFPIFTTTASRIKKTLNGEGSASSWWLRSPHPTSSSQFMYVNYNGSTSSSNANNGNSICFGFCV